MINIKIYLIAILVTFIVGVFASLVKNPPTQPPEIIVVSKGCSYYELYHSRRSQHYEYIHCSFCTNIQHKLEKD